MNDFKNLRHPRWPFRLLEKFCPVYLLEEIEGDLLQRFERDANALGEKKARRRLVWNVIRYLRPEILLRNKPRIEVNSYFLLGNYFKVTLRQIDRNRVFTLINMLGLGLAFCSSLLIFQYVSYELSYDTFLPNKERIFRLQEDRLKAGVMENRWAPAVGLVGPSVKEDFHEVEEYTQVFPYELAGPAPVVSFEDHFFKERLTFFATDQFFNVFSVKVIRGHASEALRRPSTVAISQSIARKYFGDTDPLGKMLSFDRVEHFEVTAVFEDFPPNAHFHPDLLLSMETLLKEWGYKLTWGNGGFHTYVLLRTGVHPEEFESKLPAFLLRRAGEQLKIWNEEMVLNLQRIDNIHLDSHYIWEFEENGNRLKTYFLSIVGVLIVVIALINYVNLSLARALERAKEVGLRKVVGGLRGQLVQQFIFESACTHVIALIVGLLLLATCSSFVVAWLHISMPTSMLDTWSFWLSFFTVALLSISISSVYPAMVLSGFDIISVLKGRVTGAGTGPWLLRMLPTVQFSASVILMILTYCVYAQFDYMERADLGFSKDQVLVLRAPNQWDSLYNRTLDAFKKELRQNNGVNYVVATSDIPGNSPALRAGGVRRLTDPVDLGFDCTPPLVDYNYVEMLELKILAGRSFSEELMDNDSKVMINEEALKKLRILDPQNAIGEQITFWRDTFEIIGVVKNYHHESFRKEVLPMVFRFNPYYRGYISVRTNTILPAEAIGMAEQAWKKHFPEYPFEYFFLDENFNKQYANDQQFRKIISAFAFMAIFIACIGLFGLSLLLTKRREREIGIRKVLGASVSGIVLLLNRNFVGLMAISIALAIPIAWLIANQWLDGFVSRVPLSGWFFVAPAAMAMAASLASVAVQTIRAAHEDPVKSLKHE